MQVHYVSPAFAYVLLLANPAFSQTFLMGGSGKMVEASPEGTVVAREGILKRQNNNNQPIVQITNIIPQNNNNG